MLDNTTQFSLPEPQPEHDPFAKYNTPDSRILFPVGERKVGWQLRDGSYTGANDYKAIIRVNQTGDAGYLLNIVGKGYNLVHNRELFTHVEDTMRNQMLPEHLDGVMVTDKVSGFGRVCYRDYVFPAIKCKIGTRSDIAFRIIVQNGYGGSALRIHAGAIDFFCTNGMIRGEYTSTYRKHTKGLQIIGIGQAITKALLAYDEAQVVWQKWADTPVQDTTAMDFFVAIAPSIKMKDGLIEQYMVESYERGHNLWSVYSTLTNYASHSDGLFAMRRHSDDLDSSAATMMQRELNVSKWIETPEWKAMEAV